MRSLEQWFDEYSQSHQHPTNVWIHKMCVPSIYFSIVGLLMSLPTAPLLALVPYGTPMWWANWATVALVGVLWFYVRLSWRVSAIMLLFSVLCMVGNELVGRYAPLGPVSALVFLLAWIGQFYGHKVEGAKPSFFKDLQFLLIGPVWVFAKILNRASRSQKVSRS